MSDRDSTNMENSRLKVRREGGREGGGGRKGGREGGRKEGRRKKGEIRTKGKEGAHEVKKGKEMKASSGSCYL